MKFSLGTLFLHHGAENPLTVHSDHLSKHSGVQCNPSNYAFDNVDDE